VKVEPGRTPPVAGNSNVNLKFETISLSIAKFIKTNRGLWLVIFCETGDLAAFMSKLINCSYVMNHFANPQRRWNGVLKSSFQAFY
jgi:hypothetical protein